MQIYINRNCQQMGPYTQKEAQSNLAHGSLLPTDNAWHEGLESWAPLSKIFSQGAKTSNQLVLFGCISATGLILGILVWILEGSHWQEIPYYMIASLVLTYAATGVILIRKTFKTLGKQLLAVFIFTVLSILATFVVIELEIKKSNILFTILPICNIGGMLFMGTLVVLWLREKFR